jgi:hypothetical protein
MLGREDRKEGGREGGQCGQGRRIKARKRMTRRRREERKETHHQEGM